MKPFVTIIIPVYKIEEQYLRACFDSLLHQSRKDFVVIAVDDGSPDHSGQICDEYSRKDERFTVLHQQNQGVSAARNAGIKRADTDWIAFIDPDDWVESDYISALYEATHNEAETDIILFDYVQEYATKSFTKHLMIQSRRLDATWIENLRIAPFNYLKVDGKPYEYETNTVWNKLYRTSLLKNNDLLFDTDARKGQDVIFNAECFQLTNRFLYVKKPLYHYRYLQSSVTNRFNPKAQYYNEVAFKNYERIIRKYNLSQKYWDAYYARVVTRLYSCMRLYYFNVENIKPKSTLKHELDETLNKYPYSSALSQVKKTNLSSTQRIFVFFLKRRQYEILRFLVFARQHIKNIKGNKLQ